MANYRFELRKLLRKDTLPGLIRAYAYAGVISSGPCWGVLSLSASDHWYFPLQGRGDFAGYLHIPNFSLVFIRCHQPVLTSTVLAFTRFCADRAFGLTREDLILLNYNLVCPCWSGDFRRAVAVGGSSCSEQAFCSGTDGDQLRGVVQYLDALPCFCPA
ncbi:exopolysaccharide Pel transporter PelG [Alcanivorax sp.]|uniref:exopolysaccharide Pel transporter PelG n=1 Tax=Alcanivorax sp. TaxID=1872427 RepID=UPI0025C67A6D|nr:exopolysaccharide Pel transporter PelG [Alcanivorax sp.]